MRLRYTPRARHDLAEIHNYVAQANPQAARRIISIIRKETETLPQEHANSLLDVNPSWLPTVSRRMKFMCYRSLPSSLPEAIWKMC